MKKYSRGIQALVNEVRRRDIRYRVRHTRHGETVVIIGMHLVFNWFLFPTKHGFSVTTSSDILNVFFTCRTAAEAVAAARVENIKKW